MPKDIDTKSEDRHLQDRHLRVAELTNQIFHLEVFNAVRLRFHDTPFVGVAFAELDIVLCRNKFYACQIVRIECKQPLVPQVVDDLHCQRGRAHRPAWQQRDAIPGARSARRWRQCTAHELRDDFARGGSAAGGHNILLKGAPGSGKTLLARTLPSILPPLTFDEMLEDLKRESGND